MNERPRGRIRRRSTSSPTRVQRTLSRVFTHSLDGKPIPSIRGARGGGVEGRRSLSGTVKSLLRIPNRTSNLPYHFN